MQVGRGGSRVLAARSPRVGTQRAATRRLRASDAPPVTRPAHPAPARSSTAVCGRCWTVAPRCAARRSWSSASTWRTGGPAAAAFATDCRARLVLAPPRLLSRLPRGQPREHHCISLHSHTLPLYLTNRPAARQGPVRSGAGGAAAGGRAPAAVRAHHCARCALHLHWRRCLRALWCVGVLPDACRAAEVCWAPARRHPAHAAACGTAPQCPAALLPDSPHWQSCSPRLHPRTCPCQASTTPRPCCCATPPACGSSC